MFEILPRCDYRVAWSVAEDMGSTRTSHEDAHLCSPASALFVVADGMGGHAAGEIAAKLAVEEVAAALADKRAQRVIETYAQSPDLETRRHVFACLRRALERANARVRSEAATSDERRGMGATLDVVWLARDKAFVAHAGDSRVYVARQTAVLQLTQDHAQLDSLKAGGKVRPNTVIPANRNRLINAVGIAETIAVDTLFVDLGRGDRLLLCTDGVHGQIDGESRLAELLRTGSPEQAARALVKAAGTRGRDNATAIVIEVGERFVKRAGIDRGVTGPDLETVASSALLSGLPQPIVLGALAAAVEIELEAGVTVPSVVANDLVAYLVLDGTLRFGTRHVGKGGLLFAESLVGVWSAADLPVVEDRVRLLRVRADDFQEVCAADAERAAALYRRIAEHLARAMAATKRPSAGAEPPPDSGADRASRVDG